MPKVSIIIAMYNIEEYIAYCINSCINQEGVSPDDYEIIIVNDGSIDSSPDVAVKAIEGVTNARMITRVNGGLSAARNTGIENARGEYIWFVDGDDAIASNALSVLLSKIEQYNGDAFLINFSTFDGENKITTSNFVGSQDMESGKEYHFSQNRILPIMAWLTIYKAEVLKENSILFLPNIIHEDFEFSIRAHHVSSSIYFIKEDLYFYRIGRAGSIMSECRKDKTKTFLSELAISNSFKTFFKGDDNTFIRTLYAICAKAFIKNYYHPSCFRKDKTRYVFETNKRIFYKDLWNSRQWKFRLFLIFVFSFPSNIITGILPMFDKSRKLM